MEYHLKLYPTISWQELFSCWERIFHHKSGTLNRKDRTLGNYLIIKKMEERDGLRAKSRLDPFLTPFAFVGVWKMHNTKRGKVGKPPRLRFRPGDLFREKRTNQLYRCEFCYRLKERPKEWFFILQKESSAPLTTSNQDSIQYAPFRSQEHAIEFFGDCGGSIVTNKKLLNEFNRVESSGCNGALWGGNYVW